MGSSKTILKRIHSVKNTRKITRTMEMVSTAKSKRMVDQLKRATPYQKKLLAIFGSIMEAGGDYSHPLLQDTNKEGPASEKKVALIVVSANRGLCGGYNSNVLRLAHSTYKNIISSGASCDLFLIGKKALRFMSFLKIAAKAENTSLSDSLSYEAASEVISPWIEAFSKDTYSHLQVVSTAYRSGAKQEAALIPLLPMDHSTLEEEVQTSISTNEDAQFSQNYIFEGDVTEILDHILPFIVKNSFYHILLEALASEHIYRRIAMKNATDAASEMLKSLKLSYNRARQASITQELAEIVAGADAI